MSDAYIGEIRLFSFDRIPRGWLICAGQLLQIRQYSAVFSLLSTMYGGDGKTTFGLPDLRGRVPIGAYGTLQQGPAGLAYAAGAETVPLGATMLPPHSHHLQACSLDGTGKSVTGAVYAAIPAASNVSLYAPFGSSPFPIDSSVFASVGGGAAHNNMQPFLTLTYAIAVVGVYPTRD